MLYPFVIYDLRFQIADLNLKSAIANLQLFKLFFSLEDGNHCVAKV